MSQVQKFDGSGNAPVIDIISLSAEGGAPEAPLGTNFDFSGAIADGAAADGAILFSTPGPGRMNAVVQTDGVTIHINASNQLEVITDAILGTATTIGAVTADAINFPLGATPGTYTFEARIAGFNAATPASSGFQIFATVRTTGGIGVLVGIPDLINNSEPALNMSLADIIVSGNNAIVRVTGVAGLTINWAAELERTFRG